MAEKVISNNETLGIPVIMLANKQDEESAMQIHQIKELLNPVVAKFDARESNVLGISALKGFLHSSLNYALISTERV